MKRALKLPFVVLVIVGLFAAAGAEAKDNKVDKQELNEFEGKDTYKVCFDPGGKGRP
jgi:hypothetical protein